MPKVRTETKRAKNNGQSTDLPVPEKELSSCLIQTGSQDSRVAGDFESTHVVNQVADFLRDYIVLPKSSVLVATAWVIAAWLAEKWDRFPHLAVTSTRCPGVAVHCRFWPMSTWEDERRAAVFGFSCRRSSSLMCVAVLGPSRQQGVGNCDASTFA